MQYESPKFSVCKIVNADTGLIKLAIQSIQLLSLSALLTLGCYISARAETPESQLPRYVACDGSLRDYQASDIRVVGTGDLVFTDNVATNRHAFDEFAPYLQRADLVLGNLEGNITLSDTPNKPYVPGRSYTFRFPPETATLLHDANFHVISIANNHSHDYKEIGLQDTVKYLKAAGVDTTGLPGTYIIKTIKGRKIGIVGLAHYPSFNNVLDIPGTAAFVKELRAKTDLVILFYQVGGEGPNYLEITNENELFLGEQRGNAHAFAVAMAHAGASVMIAHGPHLVRAAECIDGVPVLHSIGNFVEAGGLNNRNFSSVAAFPEVLFDADGKFKAVRIIPVAFEQDKMPKIDPQGRAILLMNWLSDRAQHRISDFTPLKFDGYADKLTEFNRWNLATRAATGLPN
jgi:poly-gamma-glutamate capsule biosynthesis protein CapA/YwtB (metallophosphatase superfamily)